MSSYEIFSAVLTLLNNFAWGPWMLFLILGTGSFLMIAIAFVPLRKLGYGFRQLIAGRQGSGDGDISPFHSLMTSLSATIGTGNIAGVATAIAWGGPGALFWMWCSALVGMATKYSEAVCAVHFREQDDEGNHVGGPMYYIKNGLGKNWMWLATAFAVFGGLAGFGIGNAVQANSVAEAIHSTVVDLTGYEQQVFGIYVDKLIIGIVMMALIGLVLLGGIKRIANVAGKIVPFMAIAYLFFGIVIIVLSLPELPRVFALIFESAFTPVAAQGAFAGTAVWWVALNAGVARGVFSNEAGLGSAPIAHAAAKTNSPVRQGVIAMLGTFIDTIVICTITGLTIIISGVWIGEAKGASMTKAAFENIIPFGNYIVTVSLIFFAFTTILGWSYYGERCVHYLFGEKTQKPFRILWVLMIPVGACMVGLDDVWKIADTLNGFMALPNLIALLLLSPVIVRLTKEHFSKP